MSVILDAGALIGVDRADRQVAAILRVAQREHIPVRTSAAVVGQVWRDGARQAAVARVLAGVDVVSFDQLVGRLVGELLARSGSSDVVDAHVALIVRTDDTVLTSDASDIQQLLETRSVKAIVASIP